MLVHVDMTPEEKAALKRLAIDKRTTLMQLLGEIVREFLYTEDKRRPK